MLQLANEKRPSLSELPDCFVIHSASDQFDQIRLLHSQYTWNICFPSQEHKLKHICKFFSQSQHIKLALPQAAQLSIFIG